MQACQTTLATLTAQPSPTSPTTFWFLPPQITLIKQNYPNQDHPKTILRPLLDHYKTTSRPPQDLSKTAKEIKQFLLIKLSANLAILAKLAIWVKLAILAD